MKIPFPFPWPVFALCLSFLSLGRCQVADADCLPGFGCSLAQGILYIHDAADAPRVAHVFWIDNTVKSINRSNPDGSEAIQIVTGLTTPIGLEAAGSRVYWSDQGTGEIASVDRSGSDHRQHATGISPRGLAVSNDARRVYYADSGLGEIRELDLDGGSFRTIASGLSNPSGVDLNADESFAYFTQIGGSSVDRVDSGGGTSTVLASGILAPIDVLEDEAGGNLFFVSGSKVQRLSLANLSSVEYDLGLTVAGVAFDPFELNLYISDAAGNQIVRVNLDGGDGIRIAATSGQPVTLSLGFESDE